MQTILRLLRAAWRVVAHELAAPPAPAMIIIAERIAARGNELHEHFAPTV
jgi:hypothetical protein